MEIYAFILVLESEISTGTMHNFRKKVLSFPIQVDIHSVIFVPKIYGDKCSQLTLFYMEDSQYAGIPIKLTKLEGKKLE